MDAIRENAQEESRLFSMLPAEIRASVFELALTCDDNLSKPYRADRIYHRPGYHYHQKIHCSLLQTCKRIYREARLLPVSANEHIFWLFNGPWKSIGRINRNTARWSSWYRSLHREQQKAVQVIHIFAQQYFLEGLGSRPQLEGFSFGTRLFHLTLRHSDWWSWESPVESNDRLGICPWRENRTSCQQMLAEPAQPSLSYIKARMIPSTWGGQICRIQGLRELKMEFETSEVKRSQLQVVVERAKHWKFPLAGENFVLEWIGELKESSWEGLLNLKDDYQVLREQPISEDAPKQKYYVVRMVWRASSATPEQLEDLEDSR
ncbi:uncharacterized protein Z518_00762 [Rhinocladiella mackenziei CBS 650.93]|uniref:F-box domain-containing protein n=1 Tax=Rhinocladiella mackenziei CBS 650.93 TaxID=1442369 RepID=A0A0D2J1V9_9EURO|nr:uncharacterized protein Z518_00762 [Rhinocladiella mackenziei CBS 650.93]KIX09681.1 hypothetical protein Z518_00762 [Rhinocladiella mackenziei CBS 650.93]